ncbi:ABC transporter permease [Lactococcus carnosus]|uniref:ABC transporter permease n=1 Tax=Pseudolactococcus carnosus TaxID=2749961 RepID=UPI001FBA6A2D|nr:ABC transporter permease [Lactococcus carnosus]MCJ1979929.1 ABC transporter permease [Lactococcus carnosus]
MRRRMSYHAFKKNKVISFILFLLVLLSVLLISTSLMVITRLNGSLDHLFQTAQVPSYVQLYSGELSQGQINTFSRTNPLVKAQQTVTMLNIPGHQLYLQTNGESEVNSMIDNSLVTQNKTFDFLLNTNNTPAQIDDGKIGVPVYHQKRYKLKLGDKLQMQIGKTRRTFIITAFIRDAQMNPSLVSSKRFLVSKHDWHDLATSLDNKEYLIEFALKDETRISEFAAQYAASSLPQSGTPLTRNLFRVLNAMSDGIVIAIIILISGFLLIIASLCLRFSMLTAITSDRREIAIMHAIGISHYQIKQCYLIQYMRIASFACVGGYLSSFILSELLTTALSDYMGTTPKGTSTYLFPLLGTLLVCLYIYLIAILILRRIKTVSAYQSLQQAQVTGNPSLVHRLGISGKSSYYLMTSIFIGIRQVFIQFRIYLLLAFVYSISIFMMSLPLSFLQTIKDPSFMTYMGAGKSDLRIDIAPIAGTPDRARQVFAYLKMEASRTNSTIQTMAKSETSAYQVKQDGKYITIKIDNSPNYQVFPLSYSLGHAPKTASDIALSSLNAAAFKKTVGDNFTLLDQGKAITLTVSGIYQDVTNGGKTAKGMLSNPDVLWTTLNLDVTSHTDIDLLKKHLTETFNPIKVTDTRDYIGQSLGGIIGQVATITKVTYGLALAITMLITTMFFKLLLAKDQQQITILKCLGIPTRRIQYQYMTQAITTLLLGLTIGLTAKNLVGEKLATLILPGVSHLSFLPTSLLTHILLPLSLTVVVGISVYFVSLSIRHIPLTLTDK